MSKNIMVWGISGGIGKAVGNKFSSEGWNVIGFGRDASGSSPHQEFIEVDLNSTFSIEQAIYSASQVTDLYQTLVYAVGDISAHHLSKLDLETWFSVINANLSGFFYVLRSSIPILSEDASVVAIGAQSERLQLPGLGPYAAAKTGLEALTVSAQKEDRKRNYVVVRPAAVKTKFWDKVPFSVPKNALDPIIVADEIFNIVSENKKGIIDLF